MAVGVEVESSFKFGQKWVAFQIIVTQHARVSVFIYTHTDDPSKHSNFDSSFHLALVCFCVTRRWSDRRKLRRFVLFPVFQHRLDTNEIENMTVSAELLQTCFTA
ncbi:hypothetical protein QVD17_15663 [Tagetes erecta]|uniref:Uncharacterized protein n=1 Tax=Tagetes erecta TaxID=13708 RepID=A0AAD8KTQ4_TARER|nr:hypothetical protein QVD17_15663 [Tagetes erecta]